MKNTALIGILMLCLGIAIGWLIKPSAPVEKTAIAVVSENTGQPVSKPSTADPQSAAPAVPGKHALREPAVKKPANMPTGPDMEQAEKMQGQIVKSMIGRQRTKLEQHIERLAASLNLSAGQKAGMTAWLDENMKKFDNLDLTNMESMSSLTDLQKSLGTDAVENELAPSLTEEQKTALADFKEKDHQTKVDSTALKNLSKLQGIIDFEDGQRDKVYEVLAAAAEEKLNKARNQPDPSALFTEGMGIEMDPYDLGIQQAMGETMGDLAKTGKGTDQKQIANSMREIIDSRINAKVEQLRPVLNEKQLEQYRTELKTKGAGVFGTALMGMEGNDSSSTIVIPAK